MTYNIRECIDETNSSSTHSWTVCTETDYQKWIKGEVYLVDEAYLPNDALGDKTFATFEEIKQAIKDYDEEFKKWVIDYGYDEEDMTTKEVIDQFLSEEYNIYTPDNYTGEYLEREDMKFTTPSGDEMHIFCKYGYDG